MNEETDQLAELDSYWNYRVVRKTFLIGEETEYRYEIHEVYYREGKPSMTTVEAMDPHGETIDNLREDLEWMKRALDKPVLDYETLEEIDG